MKITRLVLENFRAFERAELDLVGPDGKPLGAALLVGPNGAGKSSILAAISGLFSSSFYPYEGTKLDIADLRAGTEVSRISLEIQEFLLTKARTTMTLAGRILRRATRLGDEEFAPGFSEIIDTEQAMRLNDLFNYRLQEHQSPTGLIIGLDVHRLLPVRQIAGPDVTRVPKHPAERSLAPTIDSKGHVQERFGQLPQWLVNLDFRRAKAKADRGEEYPAWTTLREGLDRLLSPYTFAGVDDDNRVLFSTPHGIVPLERLSDGFRSVFVIIAELMMRLSLATDDQSRMLEGEAVCLIDELDAHLHPRWQANILPGLRTLFPNVQFIATTHSPLVVASARPEEIFYIGSEEDL